jgi:hypothetical protein
MISVEHAKTCGWKEPYFATDRKRLWGDGMEDFEEGPVVLVRMGVAPSSENSWTVFCCDGRGPVASGDGGSRVMAGVRWDDPSRELCLISNSFRQVGRSRPMDQNFKGQYRLMRLGQCQKRGIRKYLNSKFATP